MNRRGLIGSIAAFLAVPFVRSDQDVAETLWIIKKEGYKGHFAHRTLEGALRDLEWFRKHTACSPSEYSLTKYVAYPIAK